eukprot:GHVO01016824.1.p1 GENE.GHVO01016824.1~~GHVO01016824.1.p1  ORF type:complete len:240 (-),score=33.42 GHVO01016824.1:221-940(-)
MTLPAMLAVEKLGRKKLLLFGALGQGVSLGAISVCSMVPRWSAHVPIVSIAATIAFIMFFAVSWGPVLWVYLGEMFTGNVRGLGLGLAGTLNWITGICMVSVTNAFSDPKYGVAKFTIFSAFSLLLSLFILGFVKETKGCEVTPYLKRRRTTIQEGDQNKEFEKCRHLNTDELFKVVKNPESDSTARETAQYLLAERSEKDERVREMLSKKGFHPLMQVDVDVEEARGLLDSPAIERRF